jgi:hypothetical protein
MRAIQLDRPGGADALTVRDLPVPTRADGEVLIRTIASSINPVDWKTRTMAGADRLPMTLGWDLAGVVLVSDHPGFSTGDRFNQAVLVLRWFLDDTRVRQLAVDNAIGKSTAYTYLEEGLMVHGGNVDRREPARTGRSGLRGPQRQTSDRRTRKLTAEDHLQSTAQHQPLFSRGSSLTAGAGQSVMLGETAQCRLPSQLWVRCDQLDARFR